MIIDKGNPRQLRSGTSLQSDSDCSLPGPSPTGRATVLIDAESDPVVSRWMVFGILWQNAGSLFAGVIFFLLPNAVIAAQMQAAEDKPLPVTLRDRIPYGQSPINYEDTADDNPVTGMARTIRSKGIRLVEDDLRSCLDIVLEKLDIDPRSQLLVFSKTALNQPLVDPTHPRAVYFSDSISIGWVPGAESLEVVSWDLKRGPVFHTVRPDREQGLLVRRESRCLACHAGSSSWHVPGWLKRSFVTRETGEPLAGFSQRDSGSDFESRWGGWYVTGRHELVHRGNLFGTQRIEAARRHPRKFTQIAKLPELTSDYPLRSSHVVNHLILDHQVTALNLMHRLFYEARLDRSSDALVRLGDVLAFRNEPRWPGRIRRDSVRTDWFESRTPRADSGQSLFELDLETRLLRHACSWLVYSRPFASLGRKDHREIARRMFEPRGPISDQAALARRQLLQVLESSRQWLPEAFFVQARRSLAAKAILDSDQ